MTNKTENSPTLDADVIIIGGGMNGLTLSLLLSGSGFNVMCIDAATEISHVDKRTTAISYGSAEILRAANIWDDILPFACPIKNIKILDGQSPLLIDFNTDQDLHDKPIDAFGWIVENKHLLNILNKTLKRNKNITHLTGQTVTQINFFEETAQVSTTQQKKYMAHLIIGADGRKSFTRQAANIKSKQWAYNQKAIICCARHQHPHNNIAIEHFRTSGPFAILPMLDDEKGNHQSAVVWTVEKNQDESLLKNISIMNAALNERFPDEYGAVDLASTPKSYPLNFNHAYNYIGHRVALIGDAAHGIHPIAGQGLNIGLQDVSTLNNVLTLSKNQNKDIGLIENLKPYQQKRYPENTAMAIATDLLNRIFSNDIAPSRILRKHGLKLVERLTPSKRFFLNKAMGIGDKTRDKN